MKSCNKCNSKKHVAKHPIGFYICKNCWDEEKVFQKEQQYITASNYERWDKEDNTKNGRYDD